MHEYTSKKQNSLSNKDYIILNMNLNTLYLEKWTPAILKFHHTNYIITSWKSLTFLSLVDIFHWSIIANLQKNVDYLYIIGITRK